MDRLRIRQKNVIPKKKLPYRTASGLLYDSGDFAGNMARMIEVADWKGFAARRRELKKRGKLRGIGISNYLETPVGIPHERVEVTVLGSGKVELAVGTQSTGQGHETSFAQVMADLLGVHPEDIVFIGGDTAKIPSGSGTHSDRSMRLGGTLMFQASGEVVAQAKTVAAKILDVPEAEIDFTDGLFVTPNSNRRLTIYDVAQAMDDNPALAAGKTLQSKETFTGRIPAYPTGCAICEVEIDPDTGAISIPRYGSIDDAGQAINPLILHGQVHGGIVQGVGQALVEDVRYDESGQVLSGSFMDYGIPRAQLVPSFDIALTEDPTKGNPLRVKGGGEAGITPALAVVMNAIMDALKDFGVEHMDMPATPHRIWSTIQGGKGEGRGRNAMNIQIGHDAANSARARRSSSAGPICATPGIARHGPRPRRQRRARPHDPEGAGGRLPQGNGEVAALEDRCAHRFAPLSMGEVIGGNRIQCPYHGLEYDKTGECVHNPHGNKNIPSRAQSKATPWSRSTKRSGSGWATRPPTRQGAGFRRHGQRAGAAHHQARQDHGQGKLSSWSSTICSISATPPTCTRASWATPTPWKARSPSSRTATTSPSGVTRPTPSRPGMNKLMWPQSPPRVDKITSIRWMAPSTLRLDDRYLRDRGERRDGYRLSRRPHPDA